MKIITIEKVIYSIDDVLSDPGLKNRVFEKYRDFNVDDNGWHDCTLENWTEKLENYGFICPEINYTGFWSQGDGASFTCYRVDIPVFIEHFNDEIGLTDKQKNLLLALMKYYYVFGFDVKRCDHHYYHSGTVFVDSEDCLYYLQRKAPRLASFLENVMQRIEDVISKKVIEFSSKIYRELEDAYEYLTSEDAVFESLRANEYEFTEDGNIY